MDLNFSDVILHLVNILVFYLLLRVLLYNPVRRFMDARAARVQAQLDEAAQANAQALASRDAYEKRLAAVEEEAHQKLLESNRSAGEAAAAITAQAQEQAQAILDQARAEADRQRADLKRQLRPQITGMAVEMAEKLLAREVRVEDNRALIDIFFQSQEKVG